MVRKPTQGTSTHKQTDRNTREKLYTTDAANVYGFNRDGTLTEDVVDLVKPKGRHNEGKFNHDCTERQNSSDEHREDGREVPNLQQ